MTAQWPKRGAAPWDTALRAYIDDGDLIRHDTAAQWAAANTLLAVGEAGYETDTGRLKVGNGTDVWSALEYYDEHVADAVVTSGAVTAAIADEQTVIDAAAAAVANAAENERITKTTVADAIFEWWNYPQATYLNDPYPRTVFGAADKESWILACEFNHATGRTRRYRVAEALGQGGLPDDHVPPALWIEPGRRPIIMWTRHNIDSVLRLKVGSASGDLRALADAPEQTLGSANTTSYPQIHKIKHLSDDAQDTFWAFYRASNRKWEMRQFSVNQATGIVTSIPPVRTLIDWSDIPNPNNYLIQVYLAAVPANGTGAQVVRCGLIPAERFSVASPFYIEIDLVTGAITQPADPAFAANLDGTNLPITFSALTPLLTQAAPRFLFATRSGPDLPAVGYVEGPASARVNKLVEINSNAGLIPSGGHAIADYDPAMNTDSFTYTAVFRTPSTALTGPTDLGRRFASPNGWTVRLQPDKRVFLSLQWNDGIETPISTAAIPFAWGDAIGVRTEVNTTTDFVTFSYTLNPFAATPTWTVLGTPIAVDPARTIAATTNPLQIPGLTNPVLPAMYRAELRDEAGALVAGVDWRSGAWPQGSATFTDAAGRAWSLAGNAAVVPLVREVSLGSDGPTFGNAYSRGVSFENPSRDGVVIVADGIDGTETLTRCLPAPGGGYSREVLAQQPRADGAFVRPFVPINGGPFRTLVTDMIRYDGGATGYSEYEGNVKGVS